MQANEHVPASLDEVISEIVTILARGYMRHRNGRRLAPDTEAFIHSRVNASDTAARTDRPPGAKPMNQGGFGWKQRLIKRSRGSPG